MTEKKKMEKTLKDKVNEFVGIVSEFVSYVLPKKEKNYFNGGQTGTEEAFIGYPQIVQGSNESLRFHKTLNERNKKHFGFY